MRAAADELIAEARALGERIWMLDTWERRAIVVDGHRFALFQFRLEALTVGLVDTGPLRIGITGPAIAPDLAIRLTSSDNLSFPDAGE